MSNSTAALDELDHQLIALLRTDARLPVAKLAARLGVSRATVSARMDRLIESGVIAGFTIMLQNRAQTSGVRAVMMVEVDGKHADIVLRRLMGMPEIRGLHTTNGRWDLVAEIEAASLSSFDELLRKVRQIDGIANTETSILLTARKGGH
jgi:DNA-binding Lrp family transcriptional regulator